MAKKLSPWIDIEHCAARVLLGTDSNDEANRMAFIEKSPRVRLGTGQWMYGPKGDGQLCGKYQPSRDWCDAELIKLGYELGK